jgi:uncharacterized radical SAM protein YgiQ
MSGWLPTSVKELEQRGWAVGELDIILFSGDAYVDHPSFGTAVIGRVLEDAGYKVAIVPQPNWRDALRDFRKLGRPRLYFGVTAGVMDSMVNKYTAGRRLRSEDAYTPDGRHDHRPEYPTIVYTQILKRLYPDVPVVLGGIEASMRRLSHYDYWQERVRPSILVDSGADLLVYGMGEKPMVAVAKALERPTPNPQSSLYPPHSPRYRGAETRDGGEALPLTGERGEGLQLAYLTSSYVPQADDVVLASHEQCLRDKRAHAANFRLIEEESNVIHARRILQQVGNRYVIVNPPYPPMTTEELDHVYELPYTRQPHPRYQGKRIPAYEMIRHSITLHRGCFGGCAFCTISAHQGKFIVSRSKESVLREVEQITRMPDFRGYISDLGGPSANMYRMGGHDTSLCERCRRPSCLHPSICKNLNTDHGPLIDLYRAVDAHPLVKKSFVGSGVRYDLILHKDPPPTLNRLYTPLIPPVIGGQKPVKGGEPSPSRGSGERVSSGMAYARELITRHVSGRLKVAPEHTADGVLQIMRKPSFSQFEEFKRLFDRICREAGLRQQLIPYFISSHPGCTAEDMAELAVITRRLDFHLEQVQDFTPTPMTVSTEMWYTGLHPYTLRPVYSARSPQDKAAQRRFFFWYKPDERRAIIDALRRMGRPDLIPKLFGR